MHPALLAADWPAPAGVRAFTTLRSGAGVSQGPFQHFNLGSRCGDDPAAVASNRDALVDLAKMPAAPVWLRQVHGTDVHRARQANAGSSEPEADAAVSGVPGVVLAVLTADCLPVLLCSVRGDEVAAAHAGWRGLAAGVLEETVRAMATPASSLMAWLGPAAGPENYEIGEEVFAAFTKRDPAAADAFVATRPGHWRVDLYALARQRLTAAGLPPTRIHGGDYCTIGDPGRFYSHRRDGHSGRMASVIWIDPAG